MQVVGEVSTTGRTSTKRYALDPALTPYGAVASTLQYNVVDYFLADAG